MSEPKTSTPPPRNITKELTPAAVDTLLQFGWSFFKAGVLIVDEWPESVPEPDKDPEAIYLLIREAKVKEKQPDGTKKWVLSDKGKWNLPCGRLRIGESFENGAIREGEEESGYEIKLGELCHIGFRSDVDNPYIIMIFNATTGNFLRRPDPEEVAETDWFTYSQILDLRDQGLLRNPDLTMGAIEQYRKYDRQPDGLLVTYPPKT